MATEKGTIKRVDEKQLFPRQNDWENARKVSNWMMKALEDGRASTRERAWNLAFNDYGLDRGGIEASLEQVDAYEHIMEQAALENKAFDADSANTDRMIGSDELTNQVASRFHDMWREERKLEDGTYDPRVKTTTDEEWIREHGTHEVDIANTNYVDLPQDWQAENRAAAEDAITLIRENHGKRIDTSDVEKFEKIGDKIHRRQWLKRNKYAQNTDKDIPFKYLPLEEQLKDIRQVHVANELAAGKLIFSDEYVQSRRRKGHEQRFDSYTQPLAEVLARNYIEQHYAKIGETEGGKPKFEPAWRGVKGEKALLDASPENAVADLVAGGYTAERAASEAPRRVVDIANTPYEDLPEYWQSKYGGDAEFLVTLLDQDGEDKLRGLSPQLVHDKYGPLIYENWCERNGRPVDSPAEAFSRLSVDERQEYTDQLGVMQKWLNDRILAEYFTPEEIAMYASQVERLREIERDLENRHPEKYSPSHPNFPGMEGRMALMNRSDDAQKILMEETGVFFDAARVYLYDDITSGRPRASYESRHIPRRNESTPGPIAA